MVDSIGGEIEPEYVDIFGNGLRYILYFRDESLVVTGRFSLPIGRILQHEACDVPYLVGEMFVSAYAVFRKLYIVPRGRADDERETRCVGSVFLYHRKRVDDIAERFAHLAALSVAHEAVKVDIFERDLATEKCAHEYHTGDPEE